MNRDLRVLAIILSPNSPPLERLFWRPKIGSLEGHYGFFAQNTGNHVQIIANIVWMVIYALLRSFWEKTRRDLREFFEALKLAPWREILGFWPKTLKIMYKSWQILYQSWSTRCLDQFEPKLYAIWEKLFHGPKLALWRAILGFWHKTLEIMYKTLLILYESRSTRARDHFEPNLASIWETFLTAGNWLLGGPFWVFGPKLLKSCTKHS